jgi:hypothetical protein
LQKHSYFDLKIEIKFLFVLHLNLNYPSPAAKQEIQRQIDEMLKNDIIEHFTSEYSFPIELC